jgi:hypothetical protein
MMQLSTAQSPAASGDGPKAMVALQKDEQKSNEKRRKSAQRPWKPL